MCFCVRDVGKTFKGLEYAGFFTRSMLPDFRRFSQNLVLSVNEHTVFEEIFDFGFAQIQGIEIGHAGKFFDFLVYSLIAGNVDIGAVSSVYNPKITHEID